MNPILFQPKRLSRLQARVLQELVATGREFPVSFAEQQTDLVFVEEVPFDSNALQVNLSVGKHPLNVSISPALEGIISRRISDFGGIDVLAEPFRQALLAVISKEVLDALERVLQLSVVLRSPAEDTAMETSTNEKLFFKVQNGQGALEAMGVLDVPAEVVERVLALAKDLPVKEVQHPAKWSVKGFVIIGTTRLPIGQLAELGVNSLILIDEPCALDSGTGRLLINGDVSATVPLSVKELKGLIHSFEKALGRLPAPVQKEPTQEQANPETLNEEPSSEEMHSPGTVVDDPLLRTEIQLAYGAGEFEMVIGDGDAASSIPRISYFQPIRIFLDGRVIGMGDLVRIKKRHAVLITALEENL